MKTFRFTIPDPGLTKHEKEGRKKKEHLSHSDYIRAFIAFWIVAWFLSFFLGLLSGHISTDHIVVLLGFIIATILASYFSFFWATKHFLVEKLKEEPATTDPSA